MIATLEEIKTALRIDTDEDDARLNNMLAATLAMVLGYTGNPDLANATKETHPDIHAAVLAGMSVLYDGATDPTITMAPFLRRHRSWVF